MSSRQSAHTDQIEITRDVYTTAHDWDANTVSVDQQIITIQAIDWIVVLFGEKVTDPEGGGVTKITQGLLTK